MSLPGKKAGVAGAHAGRTGPVGGRSGAIVPGTGQRGNALSAERLAIVLEICEAVSLGAKITELLGPQRDPGLPAFKTFAAWQSEFPAVRDAYKTARELSAQNLEDRALAIAEGLVTKGAEYTGTYVQGAGKAMEQFRWSAERRSPGDFGTKAAQQTIVPIQINTTLDLGQPGGGSAVDRGNPFSFSVEIDGESGRVIEEPPDEAPEPPKGPPVPEAGAKFGLKEWPLSAIPRAVGGRPPKKRLIQPDGERKAPEKEPSGKTPKGYAAERIKELKGKAKTGE